MNAGSAAARHPFNSMMGVAYDFGAERRPIARMGALVEWGATLTPMYRSMDAVAEMKAGSTILDVPCGGGPVFRLLRPDQGVRYIAADISPSMISRAAKRARKRGLEQIEFVETSATDLPFDDEFVDLCLTYNGLQCIPNAPRAVREMSRVIRPGGKLVGSTVVRGAGRWHDFVISRYVRGGAFAEGGTLHDLELWLDNAGFRVDRIERSGALAVFEATKAVA